MSHRAVGRFALQALQRRAEPAEAQDEEAEDPAGDQEQTQPDALVLSLGVLVRHPDLRHGRPAETSAGMERRKRGWVVKNQQEEEELPLLALWRVSSAAAFRPGVRFIYPLSIFCCIYLL